MLSINEEFCSIQGEGLHTGIPMYFVRLQGCDVGCYFCDTKYTWRDGKADRFELSIIQNALSQRAAWICITGGEPYEQDLKDLVRLAKNYDFKVCVETSGGAPYQQLDIDWITLSPKDLFTKEQYKTKDEFKEHANEIKCVVTKESDVDYYIEHYYGYTNKDKPLIFQILDEAFGNGYKIDRNLVDKVFTKTAHLPDIRVMIQAHKIMEMR